MAGLSDGVMVISNPNAAGSHCSRTANTRISIIPIQKYGIAVVITKTGGTTLSRRLPRRQAATMPIPVPSTNARIVVMPTRPSVHGIASRMTRPTDAG